MLNIEDIKIKIEVLNVRIEELEKRVAELEGSQEQPKDVILKINDETIVEILKGINRIQSASAPILLQL